MPSTPPAGKTQVLLVYGRWECKLNPRRAGAGEVGSSHPRRVELVPGCLGSEGCACRRVEKEFGFCGTEGRILLLLACGVRIEVPQDRTVRVVMLTWAGWLPGLASCDIS